MACKRSRKCQEASAIFEIRTDRHTVHSDMRSDLFIFKSAREVLLRHRGNTFFDVTVTGQWSSPSACLPWKVLRSIDETDRYSRGLRTKNP